MDEFAVVRTCFIYSQWRCSAMMSTARLLRRFKGAPRTCTVVGSVSPVLKVWIVLNVASA